MPTPRAQEIIDQVVANLSPHTGVNALVLVGSNVAGSAFPPDQYSDIEIYVVAKDEQFAEVETAVKQLHSRFDNVVFEYKNQWAGWAILFDDLLRLELPTVKTSDTTIFSRSDEQKIAIIYAQPGFQLERASEVHVLPQSESAKIDQDIKDFWYMAVYTAQHIARGELWLARDAIRVSLQSKVKKLLQELNHPETLRLDRDRRIELTWSQNELNVLRTTACTYDRTDIIRCFWANIDQMKQLLKSNHTYYRQFEELETRLIPRIKAILG